MFTVADKNAGEVYCKLAKYMFIVNPTLLTVGKSRQISFLHVCYATWTQVLMSDTSMCPSVGYV